MDRQRALSARNRFAKLSLKKNRLEKDDADKKRNRSSDCIILDESFEHLQSVQPSKDQFTVKISSPILINDSDELPKDGSSLTVFDREPSRTGNVSLNISSENVSPVQASRPSIGGWSPAQTILCATPKQKTVPTTPKDVANESLKNCSIEKIQRTQKKLLDDLYGDTWKSVPALLKTIKNKYSSMDSISKKLQFRDDESDKENLKRDLEINKKLYLMGSDLKTKSNLDASEKKSKKKLFAIPPSTPDIPRLKPVRTRNVNTTVKKKKPMTVTELVASMRDDVNLLAEKVEKVHIDNSRLKPSVDSVRRLDFVASLSDNIPSWRCHIEALQYHDNFKSLKEQLARRLFAEFNSNVFGSQLDADMSITWDTKLRCTAGTTTNRSSKNSKGDQIRSSRIKLSSKVVDTPQRTRDTLVHEMCHAATWLIDGELKAGHGPLWKRWATRALRVYPQLGEISRCHDMEIHFKYTYKCSRCGYSVNRHSKSIDIEKKCCGYCRGTFEIIVNKKKKDGVVVSTPARKGGPNDFALYVKENYSAVKDKSKTHAQVMKQLGEQFSAKKNKDNGFI